MSASNNISSAYVVDTSASSSKILRRFLRIFNLFSAIKSDSNCQFEVNLENQTISIKGTDLSESFNIDPYKKTCMINGYDDIDYLLSKKELIEAFELQKTY